MITSFSGQNSFLSNFYECDVRFDGIIYPSVEHAYQAAKTTDVFWRNEIRGTGSPGRAKRLGRMVTLRPNWEAIKLDIMLQLLIEKFSNPILKDKLYKTGDHQLIEGNWWGDRFWGQCPVGVGENWLGKLLMQVRGLTEHE